MVIDKRKRVTALLLMGFVVIHGLVLGSTHAEEAESNGEFTTFEASEENETESGLFETITTTVQIDPGEMFYIYFDPEDRECSARRVPSSFIRAMLNCRVEVLTASIMGSIQTVLIYRYRRQRP